MKQTFLTTVHQLAGSFHLFVSVEPLGGTWAIPPEEAKLLNEGDEVIVSIPSMEDQFCKIHTIILLKRT
jgi:hypothetical protein